MQTFTLSLPELIASTLTGMLVWRLLLPRLAHPKASSRRSDKSESICHCCSRCFLYTLNIFYPVIIVQNNIISVFPTVNEEYESRSINFTTVEHSTLTGLRFLTRWPPPRQCSLNRSTCNSQLNCDHLTTQRKPSRVRGLMRDSSKVAMRHLLKSVRSESNVAVANQYSYYVP